MACSLCIEVGRADECELCEACGMHHKPDSPHVNLQRTVVKYACTKCRTRWTGLAGATECPNPRCRSKYVRWVDYEKTKGR